MLSLTCGQTLLVASFDATSSFFRWGSLVSIKCPPLSLTSAEPKHKNSLNLENTPHVRPDMLLLRTHARTHPVSSPSAHTPVEANAAEEPTGAWSRVQAVGAPAPGDRRRWRGGLNGVSAPTTGRGGPPGGASSRRTAPSQHVCPAVGSWNSLFRSPQQSVMNGSDLNSGKHRGELGFSPTVMSKRTFSVLLPCGRLKKLSFWIFAICNISAVYHLCLAHW